MKSSLKIVAPVLLVGFVIGYFVAAPLRGGLVAALLTILSTPASAAALIAAILAFVAGVGGPIVSYLIGAKQARAAQTSADAARTSADAAAHTAAAAGSRALANVRLQWMQSLRDTLSEYHAFLMCAEDDDPNADDQTKAKSGEKRKADELRLSYLGTQLDFC